MQHKKRCVWLTCSLLTRTWRGQSRYKRQIIRFVASQEWHEFTTLTLLRQSKLPRQKRYCLLLDYWGACCMPLLQIQTEQHRPAPWFRDRPSVLAINPTIHSSWKYILQTYTGPVYICKKLHNLAYPNIISDIPVLLTYLDRSRNIPILNKVSTNALVLGYPWITWHVTKQWRIQGYPKTSAFVLTFTSLLLFSYGNAEGCYKSGWVRLTLHILFHIKNQRDIPG